MARARGGQQLPAQLQQQPVFEPKGLAQGEGRQVEVVPGALGQHLGIEVHVQHIGRAVPAQSAVLAGWVQAPVAGPKQVFLQLGAAAAVRAHGLRALVQQQQVLGVEVGRQLRGL